MYFEKDNTNCGVISSFNRFNRYRIQQNRGDSKHNDEIGEEREITELLVTQYQNPITESVNKAN